MSRSSGVVPKPARTQAMRRGTCSGEYDLYVHRTWGAPYDPHATLYDRMGLRAPVRAQSAGGLSAQFHEDRRSRERFPAAHDRACTAKIEGWIAAAVLVRLPPVVREQPHLLHVFSTFVPAGPESRAVRLIEGAGHEFRHTIVAMDGRTSASELLSGKYDVRIGETPPRAGSIATLRRMRALLVELRPHALLTYNWGAFDSVLAARSLGYSRVVHHEDGFNVDEAQEFKARRVWARRLVLPRVHRVIVPSQRLERIARDKWKLAPTKVLCVPNGIDLARFQPADGRPSLRHKLGIPSRAPVVGWVGHLRPEKNPLRFLKAAARVDAELDAHFLVLGDGAERAACEELAAKTPTLYGRTHFVGHIADPREHYRAMDMFCISSDTEQMPIALVEAMASALPVVTTDVGDVRTMLAPEQSDWVLPLDERESAWPLAEKLTAMARDPDVRARLGRANRTKALADYDFKTMLDAHREVWRSAVRG